MVSLTTYTDNITGVAHGQNGHHFIRLFVNIYNFAVTSTLWVSVSGDAVIPFGQTLASSFSFKFPHSNCCGNLGCGYQITVEERDSSGTVVLSSATAPPVELCPTGDLYSAQNPIILSCSTVAGVNTPILVKSVPAIPNFTIQAFKDGDSTYTPVASSVTDNSGLATIIIPTTLNGEKYWISAIGNGYKESFSNSVVIGGTCYNLQINETFTCVAGGSNVTFNPSGGSGNYKYSLTNNDSIGYFPLTTLFLPNGLNQVYIRDENDHNYKVMYSKQVNCQCACHKGKIATNGFYSYTDCVGTFKSGENFINNVVCFDYGQPWETVYDLGEDASCSCTQPPVPIPSAPVCNQYTFQNTSSNNYNYNYVGGSNVLLANSATTVCTSGLGNTIVQQITGIPLVNLAGVTIIGTGTCNCTIVPPTPTVLPTPIPLPVPPVIRTVFWEYIFEGETCTELTDFNNFTINQIYTNGLGIIVGNLAYLDVSLTTLIPTGIFKKTDNSICLEISNGQIISIF